MDTQVDLEALVAGLPDMIAIADENGVVFANAAWESVLGWPRDRVLGDGFVGLVHPDDLTETLEVLAAVRTGAPNVDFGNRLRHVDGEYRFVRWSLVAHGEMIHASARDITQYRDMRLQLGESLAVASGVLATAVDPIIVIDASGVITQANEATSILFGHPTNDMVGQNVSMLMPEPYRSEHDGYLAAYLAGGDPQVIGRGREVEAQRQDGSTFPMALAVSEVIAGDRTLFTGIIHDLTERNQQRDELAEAARILEQRVEERTEALQALLAEFRRSNEDLERFAYIASHDLQAPLRNVRQGLELLEENFDESGMEFNAEAVELRRLVLASIGRMEALIGGLLSYARVHSTEEQTPLEDIDLAELTADVVAMLAVELDEVDAVVEIGDLPTVEGRGSLILQVIQNLVTNAVRYRSPDRRLVLRIDAEIDAAGVTMRVADNGIGVDEAHRDRVFDMFRRGRADHEGVGIGLALCRRIIEGHGGSIEILPASGEGTTFAVWFPTRASLRVRTA